MNLGTQLPQEPENRMMGIFATIAGIAIGKYTGILLLVPGVAAFVAYLLLLKLMGRDRKMLGATAIQLGHAAWFGLAGLVSAENAPAMLAELLIFCPGIVWNLARPSKWSVGYLTFYQGVSIAFNFQAFLAAEVGSVNHRALVVHLFFRITALVLIWIDLRRPDKTKAASTTKHAA